MKLIAIHSHPGVRNRSEPGRGWAGGREEGSTGGAGGRVSGGRGRKIIPWNVQRVTLREQNRDRLRRVIGVIERSG